MRLARRFSTAPLGFTPRGALDRAGGRTGRGRSAAQLDHRPRRGLARLGRHPAHRSAPETPDTLSLQRGDPLLAGGPDRYARRLAAWGLALGLIDDEAAALDFRADLFAALAGGLVAIGARLPFGARVNPLAPDPAVPPPTLIPELGARAFPASAALLRAGRGLAARLPAGVAQRLAAVAQAVIRCEGDAVACASLEVNQALARAAWAAREAGMADAAIADAIALGRAGVEIAADGAPPMALTASAKPSDVIAAGDAARSAAALGWETAALTLAFARDDAERLELAAIAPTGVVNALAFDGADGFDAEEFAAAVRLAFLALDIDGRCGFLAEPAAAHRRHAARPVALGLGGLAELIVARGLAYDSDTARSLAGALGQQAADETATLGVELGGGHALRFCAVDDPEIALKLGCVSLGAAPWAGPVTLAETADGAIVRTLAEPALRAAAAAGVELDTLRRALL